MTQLQQNFISDIEDLQEKGLISKDYAIFLEALKKKDILKLPKENECLYYGTDDGFPNIIPKQSK